jgi:hypothetical protein
MPIEKKPFVNYDTEDKKKETVIRVKLNLEWQALLSDAKKRLRQEKESTAFKQLAEIGYKVLLDDKIATYIDIVFENNRKNKRLGINEF